MFHYSCFESQRFFFHLLIMTHFGMIIKIGIWSLSIRKKNRQKKLSNLKIHCISWVSTFVHSIHHAWYHISMYHIYTHCISCKFSRVSCFLNHIFCACTHWGISVTESLTRQLRLRTITCRKGYSKSCRGWGKKCIMVLEDTAERTCGSNFRRNSWSITPLGSIWKSESQLN